MTTPARTRAAQITAVADRLAAKDHAAACAAWDARDHDVDRKVLLNWVENWADRHADLVHGELTADQADTVLYDTARQWTHPAARPQLVFLVAALREAVDRLRALRGGLLDPLDVHDGPCWAGSRQEIAESMLSDDVDAALVPLLQGRPPRTSTPECDGESHWDGQRDRDGESAELGPCPRWGDRGDSAVVVLCALASCALVVLLLVGGIALHLADRDCHARSTTPAAHRLCEDLNR